MIIAYVFISIKRWIFFFNSSSIEKQLLLLFTCKSSRKR